MRRVVYSDQWGEIVEVTRYRGKRGQFVSDRYGKRAAKERKPWIKSETRQWKIAEGKRGEPITVRTPDVLMKTTYPGSLADNEGDIYRTLEDTNLFTQVAKAQTALINIRGRDEEGRLVRLESEINVGRQNEDQQLTWAVRMLMAENGYRANYNLQVIRVASIRRRVAKLIPLVDVQIAITLLR